MFNASEYLKRYIPLVDFIAEVTGKNSEVVLHDLIDLDTSVIAIRNNYITNREVGAPATDFVLRMIKENKNADRDYIVNYRGINKKDKKTLRSSSFFIRHEGDLIGMICVNTDEAIIDELQQAVDAIVNLYTRNEKATEHPEHPDEPEVFTSSIEEMAENVVLDMTTKRGVGVEYLKQDDKIEAIETLHEHGFFLLKGAVPEISTALKISEPTAYRYLQMVKAKESEKNKKRR